MPRFFDLGHHDGDVQPDDGRNLRRRHRGERRAHSTSEDVPANASTYSRFSPTKWGTSFGLAHSVEPCLSEDCPTMNPNYREGSSGFRTLEADDQAAICAVYPPVREAVENNCLPRHGFSSECGSTGSKGCCSTAIGGVARSGSEAVFALLLGAGLWVSRRQKAPKLAHATERIFVPAILTTTPELERIAESARRAPLLAVDVEGNGLFVYRARLCTIQLAWTVDGVEQMVVVDTLAVTSGAARWICWGQKARRKCCTTLRSMPSCSPSAA